MRPFTRAAKLIITNMPKLIHVCAESNNWTVSGGIPLARPMLIRREKKIRLRKTTEPIATSTTYETKNDVNLQRAFPNNVRYERIVGSFLAGLTNGGNTIAGMHVKPY
jgi:hypothetical protein